MSFSGDNRSELPVEEKTRDAENFPEPERTSGIQISEKPPDDLQTPGGGERNAEGRCSPVGGVAAVGQEEEHQTQISGPVSPARPRHGASRSDGTKYKQIIASHSKKPVLCVKKPKLESRARWSSEDTRESFRFSRTDRTNTSLTSVATDSTQNLTPVTSCSTADYTDFSISDSDCCCVSETVSERLDSNTFDERDSSQSDRPFERHKYENVGDAEIHFDQKMDEKREKEVDDGEIQIIDREIDMDGSEVKTDKNNLTSQIESKTETSYDALTDTTYDSTTTSSASHTCSANVIHSDALFTPIREQLAESKLTSLTKILHESPEGVDMKISLFMAACSHDPKTLRPFPDKIFEDNEANRNLLYCIAEEIPCISMLRFYMKEKRSEPLRKELLPILDWLIRCEEPRLEVVAEKHFKKIFDNISETDKKYYPSKIFRIKVKRKAENEDFWSSWKADCETKFGYHRCKVEQAHCLLRHGLDGDTCEGPSGPGIYLTDDLGTCLQSSPSSRTWGKSFIATKVKLIFVTEFINNHNVLVYNGTGPPFNKIGGDEKFKYYYLKKPKLVRLRYLLVYVKEPSVLPNNPLNPVGRYSSKLLKYLKVIRVALLLATIFMGFAASRKTNKPSPSAMLDTLQSYYHRLSEEFQNWSIWQYVETPYIRISAPLPGTANLPHPVSSLTHT